MHSFHKNRKIGTVCFIAYPRRQMHYNFIKYMNVEKLLKFASKPEQPGLSSSIRCVGANRVCQNWPVKMNHKKSLKARNLVLRQKLNLRKQNFRKQNIKEPA